jgi:phytoene desaturase
VVIGAGVSGLAVAARLARLQHEVVVCDRAAGPGGQAGRHLSDGFAFDTGPTEILLPAGFRDLWIKTGKTTPIERYVDLQPVEPAVRWQFGDGVAVDLPNASRAGTMDALTAALGPAAAADWDRLLELGSDLWKVFRAGFHTPPPASRLLALRSKEGRAWVAALSPAKTLADLTDRHLGDQRLVAAAHSYALRLGSDPRRVGAAVALWPSMEHTFGVWRVAGGVRHLVDAMCERATSRRVVLRFECAVAAILHEGRRVRGVRLASGETVPAEIVVSAVDHDVTRELLGERRRRSGAESVSAFTLMLALNGDAPLPSTISFSPRPEVELREVFDSAQPPHDPTLFVSPADAPSGAAACTVTVVVPRHGPAVRGSAEVDWTDTATDAYARRLLEVLDRRGFGVSGRLRWWKALSPADVERRSGAPGGAVGGAALDGLHGTLFRPPNTTELPGLYQVGSSAHPGPGLAFAPRGAALVAETIGRARPGT